MSQTPLSFTSSATVAKIDCAACISRMDVAVPNHSGSRIEVVRLGPDDWLLWRKLRLEALNQAPHAFSSKLIDWQGEADSEGRWRARLFAVPFNVVGYLDGAEAGMVSGTASQERAVELISMWVAPSARRRGVGGALITAVLAWAIEQKALHINVAVFEDNQSAIALYRRYGFVDCGAIDPVGSRAPMERRMVRDV